MARLISPYAGVWPRLPSHRFVFDGHMLERHLGAKDADDLRELCLRYGLPTFAAVTHHRYGGGHWPLFLELAERMDRPVRDLTPYVMQVR